MYRNNNHCRYGEHIGDIDDWWVIYYNGEYFLQEGSKLIFRVLVNETNSDIEIVNIEKFNKTKHENPDLKLFFFFASRLGKNVIIAPKNIRERNKIIKLLYLLHPCLIDDEKILLNEYYRPDRFKRFNYQHKSPMAAIYSVFVQLPSKDYNENS